MIKNNVLERDDPEFYIRPLGKNGLIVSAYGTDMLLRNIADLDRLIIALQEFKRIKLAQEKEEIK